MKFNTTFILILSLLLVFTMSYAQDEAVPLTVETKETPYIVIDTALYEQIAQLDAKANLILDDLALIKSHLGIGEPTPATSHAININTATYDELLTVPGIGPIKAGSIIAERGQGGVFADWADMMKRVSGVGPATIADMQAGGAVLE